MTAVTEVSNADANAVHRASAYTISQSKRQIKNGTTRVVRTTRCWAMDESNGSLDVLCHSLIDQVFVTEDNDIRYCYKYFIFYAWLTQNSIYSCHRVVKTCLRHTSGMIFSSRGLENNLVSKVRVQHQKHFPTELYTPPRRLLTSWRIFHSSSFYPNLIWKFFFIKRWIIS